MISALKSLPPLAVCAILSVSASAGAQALGPSMWVGFEVAKGDFNGDGFEDLAVGAPATRVDSFDLAGAIHVYYGSVSGPSTGQVWSQASPSVLGDPLAGGLGLFGAVMAVGDFDGDTYDDLAAFGAGGVHVFYGGPIGLSATRDQLWNQDSAGVEDSLEPDDQFGLALAAGDFNGDGRDDLAIGIPNEELTSATTDAGAVAVIYGSGTGLDATATPDQLWTQDSPNVAGGCEPGDSFGSALAAGDFNGDGKDDLAIGSRFEDIGKVVDAGMVNVIHGSASGLNAVTVPSQGWSQNTAGVTDTCEPNDHFGSALAAGDFNGDGRDDLAVGATDESGANGVSAGALHVFYGASAGGLAATDNKYQFFSQDSPDVKGVSQASDYFAHQLSVGDFNHDLKDDLAIGISGKERAGLALSNPGLMHVIYGSVNGISATAVPDQEWSIDSVGTPPMPIADQDQFGLGVVGGDFNGDGFDDLAVSAPFKQATTFSGSGTITVIYGAGPLGLAARNGQTFHERLCAYQVEPFDCMDLDNDGAPTGVERLAGLILSGENDAPSATNDRDWDDDGIPDGKEIIGLIPPSAGAGYTVSYLTDPKKPTIYVVLLHPPVVNGFAPSTTLKANLQSYFSAGGSSLEVKILTKEVAAGQLSAFNASCAQTIASEGAAPAQQLGWMSATTLNNYLGPATPTDGGVTVIAPYAHVGRLCISDDAATPVKGAIQYMGGWQFVAKMRTPASGWPSSRLALWHRALASLTAHELGHSLGLGHGGDSDEDCSPLYPSVMNHLYDFQLGTNTTCNAIGFSTGVLEADMSPLEIRAGQSEYDVLNGVATDTGLPVTPDHLRFLPCIANGDVASTLVTDVNPMITVCGTRSNNTPIYCANWDEDDYFGAREDETTVGLFHAVDDLYSGYSVLYARTGGIRPAEAAVSGCAEAELYTSEDALQVLLKDNDDFEDILEGDRLLKSLGRVGCGTGSCAAAVWEPPSAGQLESMRGWW